MREVTVSVYEKYCRSEYGTDDGYDRDVLLLLKEVAKDIVRDLDENGVYEIDIHIKKISDEVE